MLIHEKQKLISPRSRSEKYNRMRRKIDEITSSFVSEDNINYTIRKAVGFGLEMTYFDFVARFSLEHTVQQVAKLLLLVYFGLSIVFW